MNKNTRLVYIPLVAAVLGFAALAPAFKNIQAARAVEPVKEWEARLIVPGSPPLGPVTLTNNQRRRVMASLNFDYLVKAVPAGCKSTGDLELRPVGAAAPMIIASPDCRYFAYVGGKPAAGTDEDSAAEFSALREELFAAKSTVAAAPQAAPAAAAPAAPQ